MPKPSLSLTTEVTTKVDLTVSANARAMLTARLGERGRIDGEIKERQGRKKRIDKELDDILTNEGQGAALLDGLDIDGHKIKTVCGTSTKLDEDKLKRLFGLTEADLEQCRVTTDNEPYLKVTAPRKGKDNEG
jgi:hypothetical protein